MSRTTPEQGTRKSALCWHCVSWVAVGQRRYGILFYIFGRGSVVKLTGSTRCLSFVVGGLGWAYAGGPGPSDTLRCGSDLVGVLDPDRDPARARTHERNAKNTSPERGDRQIREHDVKSNMRSLHPTTVTRTPPPNTYNSTDNSRSTAFHAAGVLKLFQCWFMPKTVRSFYSNLQTF